MAARIPAPPAAAADVIHEREIATTGHNFVWVAFDADLFSRFELRTPTDVRDWKALFGCSPLICDTIWGTLQKQILVPPRTEPVHLLWALLFLKTYGTETVCGSYVGKTAKTYRDHVWPVVEAVAALWVINFAERLWFNNGSRCKMTLDGTDFPIKEPWPFNTQWFSHKLNGPGVWYEIGVSIQTGWIVWANGPFPAAWSDSKIAKSRVYHMLEHGEKMVVDGGYRDGFFRYEGPTGQLTLYEKMKSNARVRHETVNSRIRRWRALTDLFRHDIEARHGAIFYAILNITQLQILFEEPLFQVEYYEE